MFLADQREARGCSKNYIAIDSLIKSVGKSVCHPFPPMALLCRHAQTIRKGAGYSKYFKGHQNGIIALVQQFC